MSASGFIGKIKKYIIFVQDGTGILLVVNKTGLKRLRTTEVLIAYLICFICSVIRVG